MDFQLYVSLPGWVWSMHLPLQTSKRGNRNTTPKAVVLPRLTYENGVEVLLVRLAAQEIPQSLGVPGGPWALKS